VPATEPIGEIMNIQWNGDLEVNKKVCRRERVFLISSYSGGFWNRLAFLLSVCQCLGQAAAFFLARKLKSLPLGLNPTRFARYPVSLPPVAVEGELLSVGEKTEQDKIYVEYRTSAQIPKPPVKYMG